MSRQATHLDNGRRAAWIAAVLKLPDDKGNTLSGTQRHALLLLAATGLRLREALRLAWAEIDLRSATLILAPERMKGGREHKLPIPRRTLAMLKARRKADPKGAYVFPGPTIPVPPTTARHWIAFHSRPSPRSASNSLVLEEEGGVDPDRDRVAFMGNDALDLGPAAGRDDVGDAEVHVGDDLKQL